MNDINGIINLINKEIEAVNTSYSQESPEWSEALDRISKDIKDLEGHLQSMPDSPSEIKEVRLSVSVDKKGKAGTTIEIPAGQRIISYSDFSELFRKPEEIQRANEDKKNTDKSLLLNILKDAVIRSKDKFAAADNLEDVLRELKEHRENIPDDNTPLSEKGQWLKELAKTISSLKIIESAIKSIKDKIPQIWDQLTFKQKLGVALLLPAAGVSIFIGIKFGGIGLAAVGTAVGFSSTYVVLIILFAIIGIINTIEFLDFLIRLFGDDTDEVDEDKDKEEKEE